MYTPHPGTLRDTICRAFLSNPRMNLDELIYALGSRRTSNVKVAVRDLKLLKALVCSDGQLTLASYLQMYYRDGTKPAAQEVVLTSIFKPWSGKHNLPRIPLRPDADPLRDMSFQTGTQGFGGPRYD